MAFAPLHALSVFVVVARRRSFSRAAKELDISPSGVSQAIQRLEAHVGQALFTRTTRSVALTEAGLRLLESAGPAITQAVESVEQAKASPNEVAGNLRLTIPRLAVGQIEPALAAFVARHPRMNVEVTIDDHLVDIVAEGFDAGIRLNESIERDMVQTRIRGPFAFVIVGSKAYLEKHPAPEHPRDLLAHVCVGFRRTNGAHYRWELERGRKTYRVPVRGPITSNDSANILALVESGVGLGYVPEMEARRGIEDGTLVPVLENYAARVPGLFLFFPSRARISPALRAFVDVAKELAGKEPIDRKKRERGS
jgi:DNA-binding transcriptional LysR family regulator